MSEQPENIEIDSERARTLYVRLPHRIKDDKQVYKLFPNNVKVKLPRQSSRCCHVIFPTLEERTKCLKLMKGTLIDNKKLILMTLEEKSLDKNKRNFKIKKEAKKKISITLPKINTSFTQSLHVSNIPNGTSVSDIKEAFPGCLTVALLKGIPGKSRNAVVKMETVSDATSYLKKEKSPPKIDGNILKIHTYKKKSKAQRKKNQKIKAILKQVSNSNSKKEKVSHVIQKIKKKKP